MKLDQLRRYAVARSLFSATSLSKALQRLGFVQADPLRAPARAQDLTLRHRVAAYRDGDLASRYPQLAIEEDFFVNYGFVLWAQAPARECWRGPESKWERAPARECWPEPLQ